MPGSKSIQPSDRGSDLKKLTPNQQLFVKCLLADQTFSVVNAARKAGYKNPSQAGYKLLNNTLVSKVVGKAIKERMDRLDITADRVLEELACIAFYNPLELFDDAGGFVNVTNIPEALARAMSGMDVISYTDQEGSVHTTFKPRFSSKIAALELVAKHLGMAMGESKVQLEHNVGPELLEALLKKVERADNIIDTKFIEKSREGEDDAEDTK